MSEPYETILTETRGRVLLITLNRPKALNALNAALIADLGHATWLRAVERSRHWEHA